MKTSLKTALLIAAGFLAVLWLEKPLRTFFISNGMDELQAKYIAGILVRISLLGGAVFLILKLKFGRFTGFTTGLKVKNLQATLFAFAFIGMGIYSNWSTYTNAVFSTFLLFTASVIIVGFVEEFVFRGTILPLFMRAFQDKKQVLYLSAILSGLLFGGIHFVNLFSQPDNLVGITSQVFFALSIGVFFCGLMLRTENIIIPSLIHGLVNFAFGAGELKSGALEKITEEAAKSADWKTILPTTVFFLFIFAGGLLMIKWSDREAVMGKI